MRRARTNTPLQALALMNDEQFVEAARAFAARLLSAEDSDRERIVRAFRLATARRPADGEVQVLEELLADALDAFASDEPGARALVRVGESTRGHELEPARLAAWTVLCSLILNLDEVVTQS